MKKYSQIFLITLLCFYSTQMKAQWVQTKGPATGNVTCLAVAGGKIFAGTYGDGILSTTDDGATWLPSSNGLSSVIYTIAVSGTNLFAGTGSGAFLSTDGGTNWTSVNHGLSGSPNCIAADGGNVFAGTNSGVYLSTDNGANWNAKSNGLTNQYIESLALSGGNVFAGTAGGGAFLSTDNGTNWTSINNGLTEPNIYELTISGSNIFAGTNNGIFISTNNGTSWATAGSSLSNKYISALAIYPGSGGTTNIYAGTWGSGVYLSTDDGANWTPINSGLTSRTVRSFASSGGNLFVGTNTGGVFRSTDYGTHWNATGTIPNGFVYAVEAVGSKVFAGTDIGGFVSTDRGNSWNAVSSGLDGAWVTALAVSGSQFFAGAYYKGVLLSTDNGLTWTAINNGLTNLTVISLAVCPNGSGGTTLVAGTDGAGVFISTDSGTSWTQTGLNTYSIKTLCILPSSGDTGITIFAGADQHGVYASSDNGQSWAVDNNGLPQQSLYINSLAALDGNIFLAVNGWSALYRSTDNGLSWKVSNTGFATNDAMCLTVAGNTLYAGSNAGIYVSVNNGDNWAQVNTGFASGVMVTSLGFSNSDLFVGTYGSAVWRRALSEMAPPGVPALVSPGHNAINQLVPTKLRISPGIGATGYRWQVSLNPAFSSTIVDDSTSGTANTTNVIMLSMATKYYWRVRAYNPFGVSAFTEPDSFKTIGTPLIPNLLQPASNATNMRTDTIAFRWNSSLGATKYLFQLSKNSGFSSYVVNDSSLIDTTRKVIGLDHQTKYYWRVNAYNTFGFSSFAIGSFTTMIAVSVNDKNGFPKEFALYQNYPNPFNPSTVISYQLPVSSLVTLKIYDVLGREVATLVNDYQQAGIYHSAFSILHSEFTSGVYIYKLTAETYSEVRKMIVLK